MDALINVTGIIAVIALVLMFTAAFSGRILLLPAIYVVQTIVQLVAIVWALCQDGPGHGAYWWTLVTPLVTLAFVYVCVGRAAIQNSFEGRMEKKA